MRTVKLIKIKDQYMLPLPESFMKLYSIKSGQSFSLEVKESTTDNTIIILTYATKSN